jgi:TolA-binding protein
MKRAERHHLKENELAHIAGSMRDVLSSNPSTARNAIWAVAIVAVLVVGFLVWRSMAGGGGDALLAETIPIEQARIGPPPLPGSPSAGLTYPTERDKQLALVAKFKTVADQYPGSQAGLFARYREAAAQALLGNTKEALEAYQQVIDRAGDSLYGQMAKLGLAGVQARSGDYDKAIATFKDLSQRKDGPIPVDGVLIELANTYLEAGKPAEAKQTYSQLVHEYPTSPFGDRARKELEQLSKS